MSYQFKNFVFEGGGVKGIAYIGALQVLNEKGVLPQIRRVGGTSAGAINAVLVGLGYSIDEMQEILWDLNFKNFMDDSWGFLGDTSRLINQFGWYKGDFFRKWIAGLIARKTGNPESTFADLERLKDAKGFKSLYFIGTNLSTRFSEIFSYEHTPQYCIADAVRISMSIPLFFASVRNSRKDIYVDGGLVENYPVKLFDRMKYATEGNFSIPIYYQSKNKSVHENEHSISEYVFNQETLGFRLDTKNEIDVFRNHAEPHHHAIDNFFDYTWALIETVLNAQDSYHLHNDDWNRTIYIDSLGVNATDFNLVNSKKEALVASGKKGTEEFFEWFDKL